MKNNQNQGKNNPQPLHFNQNQNDLADRFGKTMLFFSQIFYFFLVF